MKNKIRIDGNKLIITDYAKLNYVDSSLMDVQHIRDSITNPNEKSPSLQVTFAATHSGIITKNNTFYLPDKMRESAHTFLEPFPKPILKNHDSSGEPLGRVHSVEYVDISSAALKKIAGLEIKNKQGKSQITENLINDFCSGKMPRGMQIDVINDYLQDAVLTDFSYEGLGYIKLTANITDEDAIQKFLDGRYLTGSVNAATDSATCCICKQDWIEAGEPCEHQPGGIYDDVKMFLIAGRFEYGEYSVAHKPADRQSKVLQLQYNGVTDSVEVKNSDKKDHPYVIVPTFSTISDSASQEEENMGDNKVNKDKELDDNTDPKDNQSNDSTTPEENNDNNTEVNSVDNLLDIFFDKDQSLSEEQVELLNDALEDEVQKILDEDKELEDAKLSTEKRKSLPKSSFCGPDRSFPVTDCAHYIAAKRLIGRYKGPGDKSKILACVERKGKRLGCSGANAKDSVSDKQSNEPKEVSDKHSHVRVMRSVLSLLEDDKYYSQEAVLTKDESKMLGDILKRLSTLVTKDTFIEAAAEQDLMTKSDMQLLDEIIDLEETIGTLRDNLKESEDVKKALREEYNCLYNDISALQDQLLEEKKTSREYKVEYLNLLKSLEDKEVKEGQINELMELSDESLDAEKERLLKVVDITAVTDKLGDGTARTPSGEVLDDPTQLEDGDGKKVKLEDVKKELQVIEESYTQMAFKNKIVADKWKAHQIARLQSEGKLPEKINSMDA